MLPSDGIGQDSDHGVIALGLEAHDTKGGGNDNTHLLVIRGGDSLKGGKTRDGVLSTGRLLVDHTTDRAPDHTGGALKVERTLARVGIHALSAELGVLLAVSNHCVVHESGRVDQERKDKISQMAIHQQVMESSDDCSG